MPRSMSPGILYILKLKSTKGAWVGIKGVEEIVGGKKKAVKEC